jgi:hypothetical protein
VWVLRGLPGLSRSSGGLGVSRVRVLGDFWFNCESVDRTDLPEGHLESFGVANVT